MKKFVVAVSQFPVSGRISRNAAYIMRHIERAAQLGADLVQFPEAALSGWGRLDCPGFQEDPYRLDWAELQCQYAQVKACARRYAMALVLGSARFLPEESRPRLCLHYISPAGRELTRYDKVMLHGRERVMYTGGSRLVTRTIRGVLCGFLLCYDSCFPRLFEAYRDRGVKLLFLSMYNARNPGGRNSLDALMEAQLATRAADNGMWICVSNSSAKHSRISARVIGPDGAAVSLRRNVSGLLTCNIFERELGWTYDNRDEEMAARARVAIEQ